MIPHERFGQQTHRDPPQPRQLRRPQTEYTEGTGSFEDALPARPRRAQTEYYRGTEGEQPEGSGGRGGSSAWSSTDKYVRARQRALEETGVRERRPPAWQRPYYQQLPEPQFPQHTQGGELIRHSEQDMIPHPEARESSRPPYFLEQALEDYWAKRKKKDVMKRMGEAAEDITSGASEILEYFRKSEKSKKSRYRGDGREREKSRYRGDGRDREKSRYRGDGRDREKSRYREESREHRKSGERGERGESSKSDKSEKSSKWALVKGFTRLVKGSNEINKILQEGRIEDNKLLDVSIRFSSITTFLNDVYRGNVKDALIGTTGAYEALFGSGSVPHEIKGAQRVAEGIEGASGNQGGLLQRTIAGARDILKITGGGAEIAESVKGRMSPEKWLQQRVGEIMDSMDMFSQKYEEARRLQHEIALGERDREEGSQEVGSLYGQLLELNEEVGEHANEIWKDMEQEPLVRQLARSVTDIHNQIEEVTDMLADKGTKLGEEALSPEDRWNKSQKVPGLFRKWGILSKRQEMAMAAMQMLSDRKQWDALEWLYKQKRRTDEWLDKQQSPKQSPTLPLIGYEYISDTSPYE